MLEKTAENVADAGTDLIMKEMYNLMNTAVQVNGDIKILEESIS